MSSCVYSLFPIYTEDSIVYLPELIGKWQLEGKNDRYVEFKSGIELDATMSIKEIDPPTKSRTKVKTSFEVTVSDDDYFVLKGDTIRDRALVQAYWEAKMDSLGEELEEDFLELGDKMGEAFTNMGHAFNKMGKAFNNLTTSNSMKYSTSSKSYRMSLYDEGQVFDYEATLTLIGDDYFLDLYATEGKQVELAMESRVWFPVHTFMKIDVLDGKIAITEFDLQRMNKLFDSNLVRMRHENVDGTILITAKTEEIRKFLDKYSDDEEVFEKADYYTKVTR